MNELLVVLKSLSSLKSPQQGLFACLIVEKMLSSFDHFSVDEPENTDSIHEVLNYCFEYLTHTNDTRKSHLYSFKAKVEALTPDLNQETGAASYAFDCCVALHELLVFFENYQWKAIETIQKQAIATVDMFVQEYLDLVPSAPDLDYQIMNDSYMINEINRQHILLESIKTLTNLTARQVAELREFNKQLPKMIDLEKIY